MKLEKNGIVAATFVICFVVLLLFSLLTSGFRVDIKGIVVAIYFSLWVAAAAFVILTFIIPFIQEKREEQKTKKTQPGQGPGAVPTPFRSPRSGLPVRERIAAYVAERRREDGLPAPEPIRPSRAGTGVAQSPAESVSASVAPAVTSAGDAEGGDLGNIPLPDDFGTMDGTSGDMGSLPGLDDDDLGDLGGFSEDDDLSGGYGDAGPGSAPEIGEDLELPSPSSPADDLPDGGLPGFDGDLEPDLGESDLMTDDGMMDMSGDDILTIDEDTSSPSPSGGGLSEEGLPDLDGDLEPDILDTDLSGDEDFGDIEFMDLEPDEPKKEKK